MFPEFQKGEFRYIVAGRIRTFRPLRAATVRERFRSLTLTARIGILVETMIKPLFIKIRMVK
ncbi:MAG: hypothetical protein C4518_15010 [Desulfobacteraceae bacterium]|nr:MAG: hypothetical protein C4518_15010 [Desulfobacteraceae bacterium]